jgi:hypothetical protein
METTDKHRALRQGKIGGLDNQAQTGPVNQQL